MCCRLKPQRRGVPSIWWGRYLVRHGHILLGGISIGCSLPLACSSSLRSYGTCFRPKKESYGSLRLSFPLEAILADGPTVLLSFAGWILADWITGRVVKMNRADYTQEPGGGMALV